MLFDFWLHLIFTPQMLTVHPNILHIINRLAEWFKQPVVNTRYFLTGRMRLWRFLSSIDSCWRHMRVLTVKGKRSGVLQEARGGRGLLPTGPFEPWGGPTHTKRQTGGATVSIFSKFSGTVKIHNHSGTYYLTLMTSIFRVPELCVCCIYLKYIEVYLD